MKITTSFRLNYNPFFGDFKGRVVFADGNIVYLDNIKHFKPSVPIKNTCGPKAWLSNQGEKISRQ